MEKYMIEIDNVTKRYILGQIGGTTLHEELQRRRAKKLGKEDPTKKIGAKSYADGEEFWALSGVSFKVKKGERVGIIGHNGAGKSTLLKLLSRVTAPTSGEIGLDGRVTSMLEVGTGFNGELTGRENVYMNGAILGMTKKEIDAKMDDIIEFSECGQFIDTPVKRYSSGMYVKLAFSVAAHLDSEIMIMDEVLAVGDMAFQKKCLDKMNDVSRSEGRTILYVSHNMNTIRQLCDRVVVLSHGIVIFDGGVEEAIGIYSNECSLDYINDLDLDSITRNDSFLGTEIRLKRLVVKNNNGCYLRRGDKLKFDLYVDVKEPYDDLGYRCMLYCCDGTPISMASIKCGNIKIKLGENCFHSILNTKKLAPGKYYLKIAVFRVNELGAERHYDVLDKIANFEVDDYEIINNMHWLSQFWGHIEMDLSIAEE